jgi:hypothetical protein
MNKFHFLMILMLLPAPIGILRAAWPPDLTESELGLPSSREDGVEIRVWLGGAARVSDFYRIIRTNEVVSVDHIIWAQIAHASDDGYSEKEAKRETSFNRRLLQKGHCAGKVVETPNYMWCSKAVRSGGPWPVLFEDLLPGELWKLPPQDDKPCGYWAIVDGKAVTWEFVDGEAVTIDILDPGRRHSVSYWNPDACCGTVSCAIVDHVRQVVRNNIY